MNKKHYVVAKSNQGELTFIDYSKINGFHVSPKNEIVSPGIEVNSMVIIKPSFIEKVLKRKIRRKLEFYLNYIINDATDDDDDDSFREALDNIERYKNIVEYKYRKYLDDKFVNLLLKKINLLEKQIKTKMIYKTMVPEEKTEKKGKSR